MKVVGKLAIFATLLYGVVGIVTPEEGSVGPLQHRAKRYAPYSRAPLAYMNRLNQDSVVGDEEPLALPIGTYRKRFLLGRDEEPIRSHFREVRLKDNGPGKSSQSSSSRGAADPISSYPMLQRNTRRYIDPEALDGNEALEELSQQLAPLSDEELQTVLLLMDGYALGTQGATRRPMYMNGYYKATPEPIYNPSYLTPEDLRRVARMYEVGKRNNDNGHFFDIDDDVSGDENRNRVEFLTPKRSKRVGGGIKKANSVNRIKKETDPKVEAELEKAFQGPRALPLAGSAPVQSATTHHHGDHKAAPKTSAPSGSKAKKAIDWSEYFGVDKKSGGAAGGTTTTTKASTEPDTAKHSPSSASPTPIAPKPKAMVASRITEPSKTTGLKESKEHKKLRVREENETENKSDRKWILNEFYKNLAMAGNVKRKRDVSNDVDDLGELEQRMREAGDKIIWDAVKYTGAHKDEPLSPVELAQIKKDIIEKLATAYNLEKIREAIDNFREELMAIQTNNV